MLSKIIFLNNRIALNHVFVCGDGAALSSLTPLLANLENLLARKIWNLQPGHVVKSSDHPHEATPNDALSQVG